MNDLFPKRNLSFLPKKERKTPSQKQATHKGKKKRPSSETGVSPSMPSHSKELEATTVFPTQTKLIKT